VIALSADGSHEVVATIAWFSMCTDFLPDGQLLVVDSAQQRGQSPRSRALSCRDAGGVPQRNSFAWIVQHPAGSG
jgi:hypothetical protein